jgi:hypothetical protein
MRTQPPDYELKVVLHKENFCGKSSGLVLCPPHSWLVTEEILMEWVKKMRYRMRGVQKRLEWRIWDLRRSVVLAREVAQEWACRELMLKLLWEDGLKFLMRAQVWM